MFRGFLFYCWSAGYGSVLTINPSADSCACSNAASVRIFYQALVAKGWIPSMVAPRLLAVRMVDGSYHAGGTDCRCGCQEVKCFIWSPNAILPLRTNYQSSCCFQDNSSDCATIGGSVFLSIVRFVFAGSLHHCVRRRAVWRPQYFAGWFWPCQSCLF